MAAEIDEDISSNPINLEDFQSVSQFIKDTITSVANWTSLRETDDFFALGMDSLQVLLAVRRLRRGLALPSLATSTIYANPSVIVLADTVARLAKQHAELAKGDEQQDRLELLQ